MPGSETNNSQGGQRPFAEILRNHARTTRRLKQRREVIAQLEKLQAMPAHGLLPQQQGSRPSARRSVPVPRISSPVLLPKMHVVDVRPENLRNLPRGKQRNRIPKVGP